MFGVDDVLAGLVGGGLKMFANAQQNAYAQQAAAQERAFNAQQAGLTRAFNQSEAATSRAFDERMALQSQAFNQAEAATARGFNAAEAAKARDFSAALQFDQQVYNSREAAGARQWQERMSGSAYQRAMADMKAAGLNPMLAYQQGGASSGAGPSASSGVASSASAVGPAASSSPAHGTAGLSGATASTVAPQLRALFDSVQASALEAARATPAYDELVARARDKEATVPRTRAETRTEEAREASERARKLNIEKDTETKERMTRVAEGARSRVTGHAGPFSVNIDPDWYAPKAVQVGAQIGNWMKPGLERFGTSAKQWWNNLWSD